MSDENTYQNSIPNNAPTGTLPSDVPTGNPGVNDSYKE